MATFGHVASAFAGACAMSVSTLCFHAPTSKAQWGWIVDVPDNVSLSCREGNQIGCEWLVDLDCVKDPGNFKCTVADDTGSTCNVLELTCKRCDDDEPLAFDQIQPYCLSRPGTTHYLEWNSATSCDITPPVIPNLCPTTTISSTTTITTSAITISQTTFTGSSGTATTGSMITRTMTTGTTMTTVTACGYLFGTIVKWRTRVDNRVFCIAKEGSKYDIVICAESITNERSIPELCEGIPETTCNGGLQPVKCNDVDIVSEEARCGSVPDWADRFGNTCEDYGANDWCTFSGGLGPKWNYVAWGTFRDASFGAEAATTACCECGGGSLLDFCDSTEHFSSTYPCFCGKLARICDTNQRCTQDGSCVVADKFSVSEKWPDGAHIFGSRTFQRDTTGSSETPAYFNGDGIWIHHVPNCSDDAVGHLVIGPLWVVAVGKMGGSGRCSHLASVKSRSTTGPPSGTNVWRVLCNHGWKDMEVTISFEQEMACYCEGSWTSPEDDGCDEVQYGCPAVVCDGDPSPWCIISNPGCATEETGGGWTYCEPGEEVSGALPMSAVVAAFMLLMCTFVG